MALGEPQELGALDSLAVDKLPALGHAITAQDLADRTVAALTKPMGIVDRRP